MVAIAPCEAGKYHLEPNIKDPNGARDLHGVMEAFVRSPQSSTNIEGFQRWFDSAPPSSQIKAVGEPPQIHYLNMSGWKVDGIDSSGNLILRHNGEMKIHARDLDNRQIKANFDRVSGPDENGLYTVKAKDYARPTDPNGKPADCRLYSVIDCNCCKRNRPTTIETPSRRRLWQKRW